MAPPRSLKHLQNLNPTNPLNPLNPPIPAELIYQLAHAILSNILMAVLKYLSGLKLKKKTFHVKRASTIYVVRQVVRVKIATTFISIAK